MGSNSSTEQKKKPNYGTTLVTTKHVVKVPEYTTQTYTVTDYSDFTITKTTYFNSCNLDDLLSAINKIITDLKAINYSFAISGAWEATSGRKLSHALNKLPTYANILLACLIGYVEVINKARGIVSLQKQVDQVDSSSHDYNSVKSLQDQINSQISWFDGAVAAIKNQAALPGSINEKYTGTVDQTYRFDYGSVNSVANQAKSESNKLASIYKQYCELESKVKKDSYLFYGWNAIVLVFDKMIGKRDSIENWWTNYMRNFKSIENSLPDNEYAITETETNKESKSHEAAATPNLDTYTSDHKGSTSTFRVATGSHTESKKVQSGEKDVVSYTYSNVPRTTPSNGYIKKMMNDNYTNYNAGWQNSGLSRDEYDSNVRNSYQQRQNNTPQVDTPTPVPTPTPTPTQTPTTTASQTQTQAEFAQVTAEINAINNGTATQEQIDNYVSRLEANRADILSRYGGNPPGVPTYTDTNMFSPTYGGTQSLEIPKGSQLEQDIQQYFFIEQELKKYGK